MSHYSYASVFPLPAGVFERSRSGSEFPIPIWDSIEAEDVSDLIKQTPVETWNSLSYEHGEREAKRLRNARYAIVRRFEYVGPDEAAAKEISEHLLYRIYLGLKILRPTQVRFVVLHYYLGGAVATFSGHWRNEFYASLLDCEFGFEIRTGDLRDLSGIAPQLLKTFGDRTLPLTQAAYSLEIGYRAEFINVQHLIWVVGLDALFSTNRDTPSAVVRKRIGDFLGEGFVIYPDDRVYELPKLVGLSLKDSLDEIYKLRNHFAHGTWPEASWAGKVCRPCAAGRGDVNYSGVLLEAAAAILRGCLRKILGDNELVEMFNDKAKMHAHFVARGIA